MLRTPTHTLKGSRIFSTFAVRDSDLAKRYYGETLGLDVRFWSFSLWGSPYRLRASLAGDGARRYGNTVLSLGFWH